MTTHKDIQQYLSNANVTATTNKGEATRILGMIGVEASAWDPLTSDATKNATGSETYQIIMVDSIARLSMIPGLTRAVPWEYVDPDGIVEFFSGLMRTITSFIQATYNALINTIATIASIARSVVAGIASAIMRGVAMLKAGIMAMANFIVNLMKDFTLMLHEFGQWVLGVIQSVVDVVKGVVKFVLVALAWMSVSFYVVALKVMKAIFGGVLRENSVVRLGEKEVLFLVISGASGDLEVTITTGQYYFEELDVDLPVLIVMIGSGGEYSYMQVIPTLPLPSVTIRLNETKIAVAKASVAGTTGSYSYSIRYRKDIIAREGPDRYGYIISDTLLGFTLGTIGLATLFRIAEQTMNPYALVASVGLVMMYFATIYRMHKTVNDVTNAATRTYNVTDLHILRMALQATMILLVVYQLVIIHMMPALIWFLGEVATLGIAYSQALASAVIASLVSYIFTIFGMPQLANIISAVFGGVSIVALLGLARFAGAGNVVIASFMLFLLSMFLIGSQIGVVNDAERNILSGVELLPPNQNATYWEAPSEENSYTLTFNISIWEEGNKTLNNAKSRIMDFGIIIVEKDGPSPIDLVKIREKDPITNEYYSIPINFTKLIGEPVTIIYDAQWAGASGKYEIPDAITQTYGVDGEVYLELTGDRYAYVNGTIRFGDWAPGTYYIVVWAVDEFGNARVVPYEVGGSGSGGYVSGWRVASGNVAGYVDPVEDWENYFYTVGEDAYVPYVWDGGGYQRCVVLYFAPNTSLVLGGDVVGGVATYWGYFTFRLEIFGVGEAEAGGVLLRFFVDRAPHDVDSYVFGLSLVAILMLLPLCLDRLVRREE